MIIDYLFLIDFSAAVFGKGGVTGKNLENKKYIPINPIPILVHEILKWVIPSADTYLNTLFKMYLQKPYSETMLHLQSTKHQRPSSSTTYPFGAGF